MDKEEEGGGLIDIPDPDYSPPLVRKTHQFKSNHQQNNLWGNASRYKGSLDSADSISVVPSLVQFQNRIKPTKFPGLLKHWKQD